MSLNWNNVDYKQPWFDLDCYVVNKRTRGNVDGHDIFSQPVADAASDSQVHFGDHRDFLGGLAVDVSARRL